MSASFAPNPSPSSLAERFMTTVTDAMPGMIGYWNSELRCGFANNAYAEWFGQQPGAILGLSMVSLLGEQLFARNEAYIREALRGKKQHFERAFRKADGTVGHVWANYIPDINETGEVCGFFVLVTDVTLMKDAEARLRESEAHYRILADHSTDMVFHLDRDLVRQYVSPAAREILGYELHELVGVRPVDQIHPEDAPRVGQIFQSLLAGDAERDTVVNRIRHRDGRWIWVEAHFRAVKHPQTGVPSGIVGALRDISDRKAIEDKLNEANRRLEALAGTDGLTGLANRRFFDESLFREWNNSKRELSPIGLIMIDVDLFKTFNDCYGHLAGDECLRQVSAVIRTTIHRPRDLAARFGGEEFVLLLPDTDEAGSATIAERIREAVFRLGINHRTHPSGVVTISAGVASIAASVTEAPEALIGLADRALYHAKESGRNQVMRRSGLAPVLARRPASAV